MIVGGKPLPLPTRLNLVHDIWYSEDDLFVHFALLRRANWVKSNCSPHSVYVINNACMDGTHMPVVYIAIITNGYMCMGKGD